jgi:PAS domain S-box-containing protein
MVQAYEADFQTSYLRAFRHDYYTTNSVHTVYPFIVKPGDKVVARPPRCELDVLSQPELVADVLARGQGHGDYLVNGQRVWIIFTHFPGWDWTIGYTVPHDIKYADLRLFRKILLAIMTIITTSVLIVLAIVVKRHTEPIVRLTGAATSIAAGNLDEPIDINGTGEVRVLAWSFAQMRDAIRRDMHTLQNAKDALAQNEETLRSILTCSPDAIAMLDVEGHIQESNPATARLHGWETEALTGRSELDLVVPADQEKATRGLRLALQCGAVKDLELTFLRQDGSTFTGEITLNAIPDSQGGAQALVAITRDVTEQRQHQTRLLDYQQRLRSLAAELSLAEERQRRRLAACLHDGACQNLALIKMHLQSLAVSLSNEQRPRLTEICADITDTMEDLRDLTFDLSPPSLYIAGLEAGIESWMEQELRDKHGIAYTFRAAPKHLPLAHDLRTLLFQCVRELLINAVKHAQAKCVDVIIGVANNYISITVRDDGIGFDVSETENAMSRTGGFGLFNVRERLEFIGGCLDIQSRPGQGSCFTLTAPVATETNTPPSIVSFEPRGKADTSPRRRTSIKPVGSEG